MIILNKRNKGERNMMGENIEKIKNKPSYNPPKSGIRDQSSGIGSNSAIYPTQGQQELKKLVLTINPEKGEAIIRLADWLRNKQGISEYTTALQISGELLSVESVSTCETLDTLVSDNFVGNLGQLLSASRRL